MAIYDCGFIDDGYTRRGYLEPVKTVHPGLRFQYRPLLTAARAQIRKSIELTSDPADAEGIAAKVIHSQLTEWDLKDRHEKPVALKPENVIRVSPSLFANLWAILMEQRVSDIDPKWDEEDRAAIAARLVDSALGTPPAEVEAEAAKN